MTPESQILKLTLDWLQAKGIMAFRMNVGAVKTQDRFFRYGVPGMADVLAFPKEVIADGRWERSVLRTTDRFVCTPTWLEVKAPKGVQSGLQKSFQAKVESHGHRYVLVRCLEDLEAAFS